MYTLYSEVTITLLIRSLQHIYALNAHQTLLLLGYMRLTFNKNPTSSLSIVLKVIYITLLYAYIQTMTTIYKNFLIPYGSFTGPKFSVISINIINLTA